jgi:hypothetical protein
MAKSTAEVKPGYKTTEFWLSVAATIVSALVVSDHFAAGSPREKIAAILGAVLVAMGYQVNRGGVKRAAGGALVIALMLLPSLSIVGCAPASATNTTPQAARQATPQTGQQRAGQGDNNVAAAAGGAQAGVGDKPNRRAGDTPGQASVTWSVDENGKVTGSASGPIETLIIAQNAEYSPSASATISGSTEGTTQGQTQTPTQSPTQGNTTNQTPTATANPNIPVDVNVTPGSGG